MRRGRKKYIRWLLCFTIIILCEVTCGYSVYAVDMTEENNIDVINDNDSIFSDDKKITIENTIDEDTELKKNQEPNSNAKKSIVEDKEGHDVNVKEIDLGDYQSQMIVGEKQLLTTTVLPQDSTNHDITFSSSNTSVATINSLGRISAIATGETTITAKCEEVISKFKLVVKGKDEDKVAVSDIEISDYEEKLPVGKTMTISAKILPVDAAESTISYKSENNSIATVNSSGEVKGIKQGDVAIIVSAGSITKRVNIKVVVDTKKLSVNNNYLVLKPGGTIQIEAKAYPEESSQNIKYKSLDSTIAEVTESGLVTAKQTGNTTIIVTNGDQSISITVIVNNSGKSSTSVGHNNKSGLVAENEKTVICKDFIDPRTCLLISKEMLKYLYENKKSTLVTGSGYSIRIDGDKIVNYANELSTDIQLLKNNDGNYEFDINKGENICGEIFLSLDTKKNKDLIGKKLYLFNESKEKYEEIQYENMNCISITKAGHYLLSDGQNWSLTDYKLIFVIGSIAIIMLLAGFVVVKKSYWFW